MGLITFDSDIISIISTFDNDAVFDTFCMDTCQVLTEGRNSDHKDGSTAQKTARAILHVVIKCAKENLNQNDCKLSLKTTSLSPSQIDAITNTYTTYVKQIRELLLEDSMNLRHYVNLDWRLDVVLASRGLQSQTSPMYLLELETKAGLDTEKTILEADYATLAHMCNEIEMALDETNNNHSQRLRKYVH